MDERAQQLAAQQEVQEMSQADAVQLAQLHSSTYNTPDGEGQVHYANINSYPHEYLQSAGDDEAPSEAPQYPDELNDRQLEENFRLLEERLNQHYSLSINQQEDSESQLNERDAFKKEYILNNGLNKNLQKRLVSYNMADRPRMNFKSSHISYVQALLAQRDKFAERLKEFDQLKSTQSHQFIKQKPNEHRTSCRSLANRQGALIQQSSN